MQQKNKHFIFLFCLSIFLLSSSMTKSHAHLPPKHFVLVHGACHGAWAWYKLVPLIKSSGHNVTVLDLAASGINMQQINSLRSISDYFKPLTKFVASLPSNEKIILVAHSLGGLATSYAMERFPTKISVAVFATALMPGPTLSVSAITQEEAKRQGPQMDNQYVYGDGPDKPPTILIPGPLYLASTLYHLSPPEDLALANTVVRPLRLFGEEDMSRVLVLTKKKYGSVKRVFVIAEEDLTIKKDFQLWMIKNNTPNEVVEIKKSDHMVMMSKPVELWSHLQTIAQKYFY